MIDLTFVFRSFKGRCHGNQFLGESAKSPYPNLHSLHWLSATDWWIVILKKFDELRSNDLRYYDARLYNLGDESQQYLENGARYDQSYY